MNPCRASTVAAVLLVATACGKSAEEMRFDAMRATRQALAVGTATLAEGNQLFGSAGAFPCPTQQLTRMKAGDQCVYDSQFICKGYWASVSNDPSLCNLPPIRFRVVAAGGIP